MGSIKNFFSRLFLNQKGDNEAAKNIKGGEGKRPLLAKISSIFTKRRDNQRGRFSLRRESVCTPSELEPLECTRLSLDGTCLIRTKPGNARNSAPDYSRPYVRPAQNRPRRITEEDIRVPELKLDQIERRLSSRKASQKESVLKVLGTSSTRLRRDEAETSIDVDRPKAPLPSVQGMSLATLESSLEATSNQLKRDKAVVDVKNGTQISSLPSIERQRGLSWITLNSTRKESVEEDFSTEIRRDQAETNVDVNRLILPLPSIQRSAEFTCDTLDSYRKGSYQPESSTELKRGHAETSVDVNRLNLPLPSVQRSAEFTCDTLDSYRKGSYQPESSTQLKRDQAETNVDINRLTLPLPSVQRSAEFTCDTLDSGRKESIVPDCSTDLKRDHAETSVEIDNQRSPLPDIERSMEFTSETLDSTLGIESNELRRETNYYRGRELRQSLQQDSLQLSYNQPTDLTSISSEP